MQDNFVTLSETGALSKINDRYDNASFADKSYGKAVANIGRTFDNVFTNTTVKSDYNKDDYDFFRPSDKNQHSDEDIINACMRVYKRVGIVRNIIDLMSEFACKGIKLVHEDENIEKFYQGWFEHVNGAVVSERFLNYLYRIANVPVKRTNGRVPITFQRRWSQKSVATELSVEDPKVDFKRIPLKYTFINPNSIEVIAPELSVLTGKYIYALKLSKILTSSLSRLQTSYQGVSIEEIVKLIPDEYKNAIKTGAKLVPMVDDSLTIYYYKKDDWDTWATPMIYSIMDNIIALQKLQLADISALDGAISNIRLWRIGVLTDNPLTTILPTKAMLNKVRSILSNNVGGGTMDLVWGPELDFKESNTQVHQFLGIAKYEPTLKAIHEGLGVPGSISGSGSAGYNDNFISTQTMVERLNYGRTILNTFWNTELKRVQLAMGFNSPAKISYDQISLGDDSAMKKLIMDLVDRDIISDEDVIDNFDFIPSIVKSRLKRQIEARKNGESAPKASPFHNPQIEDDLKKIILSGGGVAPSELGIELLPRKSGEKSNKEIDGENMKNRQMQPQKYSPIGQNGRPKHSKDTIKRKERNENVKASSFVSRFMWANDAQKKIHDIILPVLLKDIYKKANARSMTSEECEKFESIKFAVLSNVSPYSEITNETILNILNSSTSINSDIVYATKMLKLRFQSKNKNEPTLDEMRQIQASAYSLFHENVNDDNTDDFDL